MSLNIDIVRHVWNVRRERAQLAGMTVTEHPRGLLRLDVIEARVLLVAVGRTAFRIQKVVGHDVRIDVGQRFEELQDGGGSGGDTGTGNYVGGEGVYGRELGG